MKPAMFGVSAGLHFAAVLVGVVLQATVLGDTDKRVALAIVLGLVLSVGLFKGVRFDRNAQDAYVAGTVAASIIWTILAVWLAWGLTYPAGDAPSLSEYTAGVMTLENAPWFVGPTVAILAASLLGCEIGRRLRQPPTAGTLASKST